MMQARWEPQLSLTSAGLAQPHPPTLLATLTASVRDFIQSILLRHDAAARCVTTALSRSAMAKAFRSLPTSVPEEHAVVVVATRDVARDGDLRSRVTFRLGDGRLQTFTIPSYGPTGIEVGDTGLLVTRVGVYLDFDPQF